MTSSELSSRIAAAKRAVLAHTALLHRGFGRTESKWKADGTRVPLWHDSEVAAIAYAVQNIIARRAAQAAVSLAPAEPAQVASLLDRLVEVAKDERQNIMPVTIELVAAGATMGDIVERLKALWGTYRETPVF